jgi:hypothetical protein
MLNMLTLKVKKLKCNFEFSPLVNDFKLQDNVFL